MLTSEQCKENRNTLRDDITGRRAAKIAYTLHIVKHGKTICNDLFGLIIGHL